MAQPTVLLIGAAGQVGSACYHSLTEAGHRVKAITRSELDITALDMIEPVVAGYSPSVVVNATAYTAVDKAEAEPERADIINHLAVKRLAEVCEAQSIPFIHLSTDYVFDGASSQPYTENSVANPQSVYGKTKHLGELAVQSAMSHYIILRTSWVFGEAGNNFVKTMLRLASQRDELSVVADQYGCPTYAGDIAATVTAFVQRIFSQEPVNWGIYHCVCQEPVSWCDFAVAIFAEARQHQLLDAVPRVQPIGTHQYPTPAVRPKYSTLATDKLALELGQMMPSWRIGLARMMNALDRP